jgi:hypothetical protein
VGGSARARHEERWTSTKKQRVAIILWNTMYLERPFNALREHGIVFPDALLTHVSPIGWEHINLTGDYTWHANRRVAEGRFRPLLPVGVPITVDRAASGS